MNEKMSWGYREIQEMVEQMDDDSLWFALRAVDAERGRRRHEKAVEFICNIERQLWELQKIYATETLDIPCPSCGVVNPISYGELWAVFRNIVDEMQS